MKDVNQKREEKILIITIIIHAIIIIGFIISLIFMSLTKPVTLIKSSDFTSYLNNLGCEVENLTQSDSKILTNLTSTNCPYKITYQIYDDELTTYENYYDLAKEVYDNKKITSITNFSAYNYENHTTLGQNYKFAIYYENSLLTGESSKANADILKALVNDFNYNYEFISINYLGLGITIFISLIYFIAYIYCFYKLFQKMSIPGWYSLIPFYNIYILSKNVLGKSWYFILYFLPLVNVVYICYLLFKLGRRFNKNTACCVALFLLPSFFIPMLVFDNSTYNKPEIASSNKFFTTINLIFKWLLTIFFLLIFLCILSSFSETKLVSDLIMSFFFLAYTILINPIITKYTANFKWYTTFKPLIVFILVILNIIAFALLPFE